MKVLELHEDVEVSLDTLGERAKAWWSGRDKYGDLIDVDGPRTRLSFALSMSCRNVRHPYCDGMRSNKARCECACHEEVRVA